MSTDLNNYVISIIRTVVPVFIGNAITTAEVFLDVDLDNTALQLAAVTAVTGVYYAVVRLAETKYPMLGVLLGWKAKVEYQPPAPAG